MALSAGHVYLLLRFHHHYKDGRRLFAQNGTCWAIQLSVTCRATRPHKQVVFAVPSDYSRYLEDLRELKTLFDMKVYAFCLMTMSICC